MSKLKIAVGSDGVGFALMSEIKAYLSERDDVEVIDLGTQSLEEAQPYYAVARKVPGLFRRERPTAVSWPAERGREWPSSPTSTKASTPA